MDNELEQMSSNGLGMILNHSYKRYDADMSAYDATDAKAGQIIGYIAIAASVLSATSASNVQSGDCQAFLASAGVVALVVAIGLAIAALFPRTIANHPSAWTAIEYWEENGDLPTVKALIEGVEDAVGKVRCGTRSKLRCLKWSYACVGVGFLCVAASVIIRVAG